MRPFHKFTQRLLPGLLLLVLLPLFSYGQAVRWERSLGGQSSATFLNGVSTNDGGYLLVGQTQAGANSAVSDSIRGSADAWLAKFNAQGVKQWDRRYGGTSLDDALSVVQTADGGYLVGGASTSGRANDKSEPNRGYYDYWVLKIDAQGRKLWDRTYGSQDQDFLQKVWQTADGGYFLAGTSQDPAASADKTQPGFGDRDYWLVRLDAQGNKLWDRAYGGDDVDELVDATPTADGGCLLTGTTRSRQSGSVSEPPFGPGGGDFDYWAIKLDAAGTPQWDRRYGGRDDDVGGQALQNADGSYYLGGTSYSGVSGVRTEPSRGGGDYWLLKLSAQGALLWDHRFGSPANDYLVRGILPLPGGGCALAGFLDDGPVGGDQTGRRQGFRDAWLVGVSATGAKLWDRIYGGNSDDAMTALIARPGGGMLAVGFTYSSQSGDQTAPLPVGAGNATWVLELDAAGQLLGRRIFTAAPDETQRAVLRTRDGGVVLAGHGVNGFGFTPPTNPGGVGITQIWLTKRDSLGAPVWDRALAATRGTRQPVVQELANGALVAGATAYRLTIDSATARTDADYALYLLDDLGQVQRRREYGGPGDDWLGELRQLPDRGYSLGGTSRSGAGLDKTEPGRGGADFWALRLNNLMNKVWDYRYGGTGLDSLVSMRPTPDGGYLLAGSTTSPVGGDVTAPGRGGADYWLVKMNNLGVIQWQGRYGGPGHDWLAQARPAPDGGFVLVGTTTSGPGGEITEPGRGGRDLWVLKVGPTGALQWQHRYGGPGQDYAAAVEVDPDGGYLVGASTSSAAGGEVSQSSRGGTDYWLLRLSAEGTVLWDQRLGGSGEDVLTCLATGRGYGYAVGGQSNSPTGSGEHHQANQGGYDMWTLLLEARRVPAPVIVAFTPASGGPGTTVVLTGSHFTGASRVTFNGAVAPGFAVGNGGTTLTVTLPAGATTGPIAVTANGTGTSAAFTVPVASSAAAGLIRDAGTLFPNPARAAVTLQLPAAAHARPVWVRTLLGQVVRQHVLPARATAALLDLRGLAGGVYLVQCEGTTRRLLVE